MSELTAPVVTELIMGDKVNVKRSPVVWTFTGCTREADGFIQVARMVDHANRTTISEVKKYVDPRDVTFRKAGKIRLLSIAAVKVGA